MTTNNAVNVGLSGSTGTGTFVGSTSPTLVTPLLGTPTSGTLTNCTGLPIAGTTGYGTGVATALAANVTGTGGISLTTSPTFVTPVLGAATATSVTFSPTTNGIVGTTTNDNAAAGVVGEVQSSTALISSTSLSNSVGATVITLSLTAGDWQVWGSVCFTGNSSTVVFWTNGGISTTAATLPANTLVGSTVYQGSFAPFATSNINYTVPSQRMSFSGTTNVYIIAEAAFSTSTCTAGGSIIARRER